MCSILTGARKTVLLHPSLTDNGHQDQASLNEPVHSTLPKPCLPYWLSRPLHPFLTLGQQPLPDGERGTGWLPSNLPE